MEGAAGVQGVVEGKGGTVREEILGAAAHIFTWTTGDELWWLAQQAMHRQHVLEIGTYMGASAVVMAEAMQRGGKGTLTCVDVFETAGVERVARLNLKGRATIHVGDTSMVAGFLWREPRRYDMIWIDDGHTYENVARDVLVARVLAAPGALVCGHDYGGEVAAAVQDCFRADREVHRGPGSIWHVTL